MLHTNAQRFGKKLHVVLVVWMVLFGHVGVAQNVKAATLHHLAYFLVVQSFVLNVTQSVVEIVVVAGEVYRANYHVRLEASQIGKLLGVVVRTAHFKTK